MFDDNSLTLQIIAVTAKIENGIQLQYVLNKKKQRQQQSTTKKITGSVASCSQLKVAKTGG